MPPADFTAAQQEIKAGTDLIAEGQYEEAMQHLEEAAKIDPREAQAYYWQGVSDRMLNRYDDAIDAFTKSITLTNQENKLDPEAYLRRGVVWFYKGEYGIAYQDFDEAASILYDDPRPELWKGLSRARQQNWLEAINSYAVALQHDDKFAPAWVNLGLGYLALNQPNKAVYCLDQAVRMEPQNAGSYFKRGIALSRMGKFREAADSYSQAIRLKPDYAEAHYALGTVLQQLGKLDDAIVAFREALKYAPNWKELKDVREALAKHAG
jgi:tetratricopeptide (TPR) repeat protein